MSVTVRICIGVGDAEKKDGAQEITMGCQLYVSQFPIRLKQWQWICHQ